jgi:L-amino acid N-acyltransferase YncA
MLVRKATLEDAYSVASLWRENRGHAVTAGSDADVVLWLEQGDSLLVAEQFGEIVGFALAWPREHTRVANCWVVVANGWRRMGTATALMKALVDDATEQRYGVLRSAILESDSAALALACKVSFHVAAHGIECGARRALVLERLLPAARQAIRTRMPEFAFMAAH